jgi:predicted RecB family nuclease
VWYTACVKLLEAADDLTLIPELGRSKREAMIECIGSIRELAEINPAGFIKGEKTVFPGIGPGTLEKFHARAKLLATPDGKPYLRAPVSFPAAELELFFDIEVDPMRDVCYLHGFVERRRGDNGSEQFVHFFGAEPTAEAEEQAFAGAWRYLQASQPCAIYYYSKYERTIYCKLRSKYPHVCSEADIEALFDPARAIDLLRRGAESDRVADAGFLDQDAGEVSRLRVARHAPVRSSLDRVVRSLGHDARSGRAAAHSRLQRGRLPSDAGAARRNSSVGVIGI